MARASGSVRALHRRYRGTMRLILTSLITLMLIVRPEVSSAQQADRAVSGQSIAIGVGAVAGIVAFNAATLGLAAFPGGLAYAAGATVPAEMAVAINRVYAVTTAVAGGWLGEYLYVRQAKARAEITDSGRMTAAALGAVVGVAAFSLTTASLGSLPWGGGVSAPVPVSVMLGSRVIAVGAAGIGALGGAWLYADSTAQPTDAGYALSLLGGALAGVVAGNLLTAGQIGTLPYYAGAGAANAGGAIATSAAAAASRVYAITFGVAGAMVAGKWYTSASAAPVKRPTP